MPDHFARQGLGICRPDVGKIAIIQTAITILIALAGGLIAPAVGWSVLAGGTVSVVSQWYFNCRATRRLGRVDAQTMVLDTFRALWGKWFILVVGSLFFVVRYQQLQAGVVFVSVLCFHTLGAFLLPLFVTNEGGNRPAAAPVGD